MVRNCLFASLFLSFLLFWYHFTVDYYYTQVRLLLYSLYSVCHETSDSKSRGIPRIQYSATRVKLLRTLLLFALSSPAGVLRALRVGRESHPWHLGSPLHDGLLDDHPRNFAAYGENTVNKWVLDELFLIVNFNLT